MPKILISYRRADTTTVAGRLVDMLTSHYGPDEIFFDFDAPGKFEEKLRQTIGQVDVVLVLIGKDWKGVRQGGKFAIENEFDPIRLEVKFSLEAGKQIIPIIVDDAFMLAPQELPEAIRELSFINCMTLDSGRDFTTGVNRLIRTIDSLQSVKKHVNSLREREPQTASDSDAMAAKRLAPKIVLSYRRSDTQAMAGRVFEHINAHFGEGVVYMDIDSIPFGINFRTHIESALGGCKVLLALIGPGWIGKRFLFQSRIFDKNDPVRLEVHTALRLKVPVLPVLIDEAKMPGELQLPKGLKGLSNLNAAPLDSGRNFEHDMKRLLRTLGDFVET